MDWQSLTQSEIFKFILAHEEENVAALALKKPPAPEWDYRLVLDQIKSRQKARRKVPSWFESSETLVFPPPEVVEQASSEATAAYKASLVRGESLADLSGGMGVDCRAFARNFQSGFCAERNETAAALLAHNFSALGLDHIKVLCRSAEDFVSTMPPVDFVYIDPQRREASKKGKFRLEDTSPDVSSLLPLLEKRAGKIMIKTSPMLDIAAGIEKLHHVSAVHVVEYRGECKEVLYMLDMAGNPVPAEEIPITAVEIDEGGKAFKSFSFTIRDERAMAASLSQPLAYLYEPGPAFQKASGFNSMAVRFGMAKLHLHTHLYTSDVFCPDFPGRGFKIYGAYPAQAGKIPLEKANLTLRNFPGDTESLRKKLKMKDGGEDYLFACTLMDGEKMLIHGRKL